MFFNLLKGRKELIIGFLRLIAVLVFLPLDVFGKTFNSQKLINLPKRYKDFIGRSSEIRAITQALHASSGFVSVFGLPGMGKTQLVKEYAYRNQRNYQVIWWFDCSRDIIQQLLSFARCWNLSAMSHGCKIPEASINSQGITKAVETVLQKSNLNWLLIFDDGPKNMEPILYDRSLSKLGYTRHILSTSNFMPSCGYKLKISEFNVFDSSKLIKKFLRENEKTYHHELAEALDHIPLSLVRALTYITRVPSIGIREYLLLHKDQKSVLEKLSNHITGFSSTMGKNRSFLSALVINLKELKKTSPISYECLVYLSFLHNKSIKLKDIQNFLLAGGKPETAIHEITYNLAERSLLEETFAGTYEIHKAVQEAIRGSLSKNEIKHVLHSVVKTFSPFIEEETSEISNNIFKYKSLRDHIRTISELLLDYHLQDQETLMFLINSFHTARYYLNDHVWCEFLRKGIQDLLKTVSVDEAFYLSRYYNTEGKHIYSQDLDEAIDLTTRALSLLDRLPRTRKVLSESFLAGCNNLIDYYLILGEVSKAEKLCQSYEEVTKDLKNPLYLVIFNSFKALIYMYKGSLNESLHIANSALSTIKKYSLPEIPLLFVKVNKAEVLARLGKFEECEELLNDLQDKLKEAYQDENNHLLLRVSALHALIEFKKNNIKLAESLGRKAIESYFQLVTSSCKDPLQGFLYTLLGDICYKQGLYAQALEEYLKAEFIYNSLFKTREMDDLSALYTKITLANLELRDYSQCARYFQLQHESFGINHPRTLQIVKLLDKRRLPIPWKSHL